MLPSFALSLSVRVFLLRRQVRWLYGSPHVIFYFMSSDWEVGGKADWIDFDERTPVVVAELNHNQAGEVFGVSKVKGGNRMVTTYLLSMCVVLYPAQKRARA